MLVPHELLDKEFLSLVETEGIADIEELNLVLERAVNLKNLLKGNERVPQVAQFVADHYRQNVEPLGYKEIEMLYEIISPYAFLRPYLDDYATLSNIYAVVRKAFHRGPEPDRTFQRKTNELVQKYISSGVIEPVRDIFAIDEQTLEVIGSRDGGDNTKVINLIKSIEKIAEEQSEDPYLVAMAERARAV